MENESTDPNPPRPRRRGGTDPWPGRLAWLRTTVNMGDLATRLCYPHTADTGSTDSVIQMGIHLVTKSAALLHEIVALLS